MKKRKGIVLALAEHVDDLDARELSLADALREAQQPVLPVERSSTI